MWGCSLSGTAFLSIFRTQRGGVLTLCGLAGRKAAPPPCGREQDMSPGRGGGEAPGDRPPPHHWDWTLQTQRWRRRRRRQIPVPSILKPEGSTVADCSRPKFCPASCETPKPRPQRPGRLEDPRYSGAQRPLLEEEPGVRDISPARPWNGSWGGRAQWLCCMKLVAPQRVESSWSRD